MIGYEKSCRLPFVGYLSILIIFLGAPVLLNFTVNPKTVAVKPPVGGHTRNQKKSPLRRGACLWQIKNAVYVCGWVSCQVSAFGRRPHSLSDAQLQAKTNLVLEIE